MSMCFVLSLGPSLLINAIVAWLSLYRLIGTVIPVISFSSIVSHFNSLTIALNALYSASVDEVETVDCFFDDHVIVQPLIWMIYPVVDLRSIKSLPHVASAYADTCRSGLSSALNCRQ